MLLTIGVVLIFGNTNCATLLFSKSLNEFLLAVLYRKTFVKVAAAVNSKKSHQMIAIQSVYFTHVI